MLTVIDRAPDTASIITATSSSHGWLATLSAAICASLGHVTDFISDAHICFGFAHVELIIRNVAGET